MTTYQYDLLVQAGDNRRVDYHDGYGAGRYYLAALRIHGDRDRYLQQMIGVCYQMRHRYKVALIWYGRALQGANSHERGNILRDMAESYRGLGEYSMAELAINESLGLLAADHYPVEHAASLGFRGRLRRSQGDLAAAIADLTEADRILSAGTNRQLELYNKLSLASALAADAHWMRARRVAGQAHRLARWHGSPKHQRRALAIICGWEELAALKGWLARR
ncbi:MAG TPA: hypothetical protein VLF67_01255 [Candidatus Saccharimonas sp.]|nr:hypothetical protein [Candidatus Saccharimonas sp.]